LAGQPFRYAFLDATYCKARVDHRVVSQAVVVATGVAADGRREVLGFDVGDSEDGAFWTALRRSLRTRGLSGAQLGISDAHAGLKAAIAAVLIGASWQRSGCISCATFWPPYQKGTPRWWRTRSATTDPTSIGHRPVLHTCPFPHRN
jgi:transposase-like protein